MVLNACVLVYAQICIVFEFLEKCCYTMGELLEFKLKIILVSLEFNFLGIHFFGNIVILATLEK